MSPAAISYIAYLDCYWATGIASKGPRGKRQRGHGESVEGATGKAFNIGWDDLTCSVFVLLLQTYEDQHSSEEEEEEEDDEESEDGEDDDITSAESESSEEEEGEQEEDQQNVNRQQQLEWDDSTLTY